MKRIHIFVIALVLAGSSLAGLSAALRTTHLGSAAGQRRVSAAEIARRNRQLNRIEGRLLAQAKAAPHALARAQSRPVVYVRPKPIVNIVHRKSEHESEGDEGAESDD
jgi:hypothetical protein